MSCGFARLRAVFGTLPLCTILTAKRNGRNSGHHLAHAINYSALGRIAGDHSGRARGARRTAGRRRHNPGETCRWRRGRAGRVELCGPPVSSPRASVPLSRSCRASTCRSSKGWSSSGFVARSSSRRARPHRPLPTGGSAARPRRRPISTAHRTRSALARGGASSSPCSTRRAAATTSPTRRSSSIRPRIRARRWHPACPFGILRRMTSHDVQALRRRLHWTQRQLAAALHVTVPTVARWEQGVRALTPLATTALTLLAQQHGVDPSHLTARPRKAS